MVLGKGSPVVSSKKRVRNEAVKAARLNISTGIQRPNSAKWGTKLAEIPPRRETKEQDPTEAFLLERVKTSS